MRIICFSLILSLTACLGSNSKYRDEEKFIKYDYVKLLVEETLICDPNKPRVHVLSTETDYNRFIEDSSDFLYFFRGKMRRSDMNFDRFDYILSYGAAIKEIKSSEKFSKTIDQCSYLKEIPLNIAYDSTVDCHKMYIYSLIEKNKYRAPCP